MTGGGLVHGFDGLMLAIVVCAALAATALLDRLAPWRRIACGALVALAYLVASYLIQGAFKETMEALLVLAFAIGLHQARRGDLVGGGGARTPLGRAVAAVPLGALAVGSVYAYSFPGLLWLVGAAVLWAAIELAVVARAQSPGSAVALARAAAPATAVAVAVACMACAPEIGRMADFASFETFNPSGPGLGNLFNPISPLEALGIWPSGDFRLDPGDGAVPAVGFYLGELLGLVALGYGLAWWAGRGERAVPAALAAAVALYAYAHFAGTPYQAAKTVVIAAPLAMLICRPRADQRRAGDRPERPHGPGGPQARRRRGRVGPAGSRGCDRSWRRPSCSPRPAAACWRLPTGRSGRRPTRRQLTELRGRLGEASTLVLVPEHVLADEHGRDYLVWELRGGRVCVGALGTPASSRPPHGAAHVITQGSAAAPYRDLVLERRAGPYTLWRASPPPAGHGSCPPILVGGRANPDQD